MLIRKTPLKTASSLPRKRARKREKGAGYNVANTLGLLRPVGAKDPVRLRSEAHRRNVAALGCIITGQPAQACHANATKGGALKACDSLCFPLSPELHRLHDQGGMDRLERRQRELAYVRETRRRLQEAGKWTTQIETFYQLNVKELERMAQ